MSVQIRVNFECDQILMDIWEWAFGKETGVDKNALKPFINCIVVMHARFGH